MSKLTDLFNKAGELMGWSDSKGGFHPKGETPNVFDSFDIKGKPAGWVEGGTHHAPSAGSGGGDALIFLAATALIVFGVIVIGATFVLIFSVFIAPITMGIGLFMRRYERHKKRGLKWALISLVLLLISIGYWIYDINHFATVHNEMVNICRTLKIQVVDTREGENTLAVFESPYPLAWYGLMLEVNGKKVETYPKAQFSQYTGDFRDTAIGFMAKWPYDSMESVQVKGIFISRIRHSFGMSLVANTLKGLLKQDFWPDRDETNTDYFSKAAYRIVCDGPRWP